jgi:uncharacterized membrane protein
MSIKLYLVTLFVFLGIDSIWLLFVAKNFYADKLGYLMAKNPNLISAGIFYLLFVVGIILFVISPALKNNSLSQAIIMGGLFGLITYATYDLTNLATIRDWPLVITIVDMIWGTVLSATVAGVSFFIYKWIA